METASIVMANTIVLEDELKYNGVTVLTYRIEYPQFSASVYQMCLNAVNRFYKTRALEYQHYVETEMFSEAVEQYISDTQNDFPVRVYEALLVYKITYSASCIISLYFDKYEFRGGAHGLTTRDSQTWNLQKCDFIELSELFRCPTDYRTYIISAILRQIRRNPDIYFENYEELVNQTFNENSFYCTPRGIVIYFQQYDIAPYASGIREFLIPYTECVLNPTSTCFSI